MQETRRGRWLRFFLNHYPVFRGVGVWLTYIGPGFSEVHVKLPLGWRTFNAVGTIFGGSMYAACDPWFMLILMRRLGPQYVVWDKAATITFKKPGRTTLTARFHIPPEEVAEIKRLLESERSVDRVYTVDLIDREGVVCATVEKVLYVRRGERDQQARNALSRWLNRWMDSA